MSIMKNRFGKSYTKDQFLISYFQNLMKKIYAIHKQQTINKSYLLILIFLFSGAFLFGQSSEQKVTTAVNEINTLMEELHQLSRQKNIKQSFAKLDEINAVYKREIHWETFSKEYRNAKMANPSFSYQIKSDLPGQLDPSFWKDYQKRCDRIMADQNVALEGFIAMTQMNNFDKMMAYGAQLKNIYETFKNGAENLMSANLPKFAYDLHGNMNDFIENYKKIEQAEVDGIDLQTRKMDFNIMMTKARKNKDLYSEYERYINSNIIAINDFQANVRYVKGLENAASDGPLKPLDFTDEFYWNYRDFQKSIEEACDEMEYYEIKCEKLKANVETIKGEARRDWSRVKGNVYSSDDEANKSKVLADNEEKWDEFIQVADRLYNEAYQLYCLDNSAGSSGSDNSNNPFDGAAASGQTKKEKPIDEKTQNVPQNETQGSNTSSNETFEIRNLKVSTDHWGYVNGVVLVNLDIDFYHTKEVFLLANVFVNGVKVTKNTWGFKSHHLNKDNNTHHLTINSPIQLKDGSAVSVTSGVYRIKLEIEIKRESTIYAETQITVKGTEIIQGKTENQESSSATTTSNEGSVHDSETKEETNTPPQAPTNSTLVGNVFSKNGGGKYRAIEVSKLKTNDRIVFQKVSGDLNYIQLIWRKEGGIWETAYEGPKTEIRVGDLIPKMPARTTHMNFVVNTHHNHWSAKNPDCEMNVYVVHGGGSSVPSTKPSENTNPQQAVNPKPKVNPKPTITPTPKPNNTPSNNTVNKEFSELLTKANEEFNKKYWEEGNGPKASSNPKQASLDLLRKASRLINSEPGVEKRYDMVLSLVNLSSRFAQRVYAYENKIPFINLAGETAGRAGSQVSGIQNPDPAKKKELQKYAYSRTAAAWKCVRDAALVQGGNFTPESCDKEYLKYKGLSER